MNSVIATVSTVIRTGGVAATSLAMLLVAAMACSSESLEPTPSPTVVTNTDVDQGFTKGKVVDVIDGTTIVVDVDGKSFQVRYLGVEVPPSGIGSADGQLLRDSALQFNRFIVEGQTVEMERDEVDTDGQGFLLRYVYVDGEMVNQSMLTSGYAIMSSDPPSLRHLNELTAAQESARRDRRGLWESAKHDLVGEAPESTPDQQGTQPFTGGTLPLPPGSPNRTPICDFSGTSDPVIKGNVDSRTREHLYYVPDSVFYSTTMISESEGDRWFCAESEALTAGWVKAKH